MTAEETAYVVALGRRRRIEQRGDHWDHSDAERAVSAARKALVELGYGREHMRHLEEVALPTEDLIERFGQPLRQGHLRRLAPEPPRPAEGQLDERKRGPIEQLRDGLDRWVAEPPDETGSPAGDA